MTLIQIKSAVLTQFPTKSGADLRFVGPALKLGLWSAEAVGEPHKLIAQVNQGRTPNSFTFMGPSDCGKGHKVESGVDADFCIGRLKELAERV